MIREIRHFVRSYRCQREGLFPSALPILMAFFFLSTPSDADIFHSFGHLLSHVLHGDKVDNPKPNQPRAINLEIDTRPVVAITSTRETQKEDNPIDFTNQDNNQKDSPNSARLCTGTVLERDCVLTARHCVDKHDKDSFEVILGPSAKGTVRYKTIDQKIKRGYPTSSKFHDLAVLKLESLVAPEYSWSLSQIPSLPIDLSQKKAIIVGYGATQREKIEGKMNFTGFGEKHSGVVNTSRTLRNLITTVPENTSRPQAALPGDSGGPLLLPGASGEAPQIVGVASRLLGEDQNVYTSTQNDRENIIGLMKAVKCGPFR